MPVTTSSANVVYFGDDIYIEEVEVDEPMSDDETVALMRITLEPTSANVVAADIDVTGDDAAGV